MTLGILIALKASHFNDVITLRYFNCIWKKPFINLKPFHRFEVLLQYVNFDLTAYSLPILAKFQYFSLIAPI